MGQDERKKMFEKAAQSHSLFGPNTKVAKGYGASNALMIVDSGLELLTPDMRGVKSNHDSFLFVGGISLPPKDELYIAVYISEEAAALKARLEEMTNIGLNPASEEEAANYKGVNNNTPLLVAWKDGKIYLRNKGHWNGDSEEVNLDLFGAGIKADRVAVAVYPPNRDATRSLNVRTYISYLAKLFRQDKIHEIHPWDIGEKDFEGFKVNPADLDPTDVRARIEKLGCYYDGDIVEQFHMALNHLPSKHFVILAGLSGGGKTSLAVKYSQAIHGIDDPDEKDPFFFMCRVRPDWTDPSGLIGYPDIVSGKYVVPEFLEAVLTAHAYPSIPVFVCLDEMNLARVEYYFSDVLSCVESHPESEIRLHHDSIPMEGSNGEDITKTLPVPNNLYIVGTINVDETTNPLSDKVLDRACVIDMSKINIKGFLEDLVKRESALSDAAIAIESVLPEANEILSMHGLGVGYRATEEVVRYYDFALKSSSQSGEEILDHLLSQKILTKLKGTERQRTMLVSLQALLAKFPSTAATIKRLIDEIDEIGGFQTLR